VKAGVGAGVTSLVAELTRQDERQSLSVEDLLPRERFEISADLAKILDLTDAEVLDTLGIVPPDVVREDQRFTQEIGEAAPLGACPLRAHDRRDVPGTPTFAFDAPRRWSGTASSIAAMCPCLLCLLDARVGRNGRVSRWP
jgi:hypothetical protein